MYTEGFKRGTKARTEGKKKGRTEKKAAQKGPEFLRGFRTGWKMARFYQGETAV